MITTSAPDPLPSTTVSDERDCSPLSVPLNYFVVYPAYVVCYHLPLETILGMYQAIRPSVDGLLECLLVFNMPFTFFKGLLDVALCFLIYKPLSPLLHK